MEEKSHRMKGFLIARILMGLFFLYVGGQKLFQLGSFILDVRAYQILFPPLDQYAAYLVVSLEILAGLLLITAGPLYRGALYTLLLLCGAFMGALSYAWGQGLELNCGCFGSSDLITNYPLHLLFNALLAIVAVVLLVEHRTWRKRYFKSKRGYTLPRI